MGALTIAFDITIVGALALPWVYLVVHLFFSDGENRIKPALGWVNKYQAQVPAGILLFAMTYTLGSAVSRIAFDFFNDDDIHIQVGGRRHGYLLRWPITEDRIRAHVYCEPRRKDLLPTEEGNSALTREVGRFRNFPDQSFRDQNFPDGNSPDHEELCKLIMWGWVPASYYVPSGKPDDDLVETAKDIFGLQENTLMDRGGDYSARLRQLHDQIMVLRGAAFSGLIAFSLCLFAWGAVLSDKPESNGKPGSGNKRDSDGKPHSWMRWLFMPAPVIYFVAGIVAFYYHLKEKFPQFPHDPPYMEFTLLLLAGAGLWMLWPPSPKSLRHTHEAGANAAGGTGNEKDTFAAPHWRIERWGRLVALSFILTLAAFLGWWSTEVMYRDQVIYSYDSQFADTQGATAPQK
jgi:hypothetical protein